MRAGREAGARRRLVGEPRRSDARAEVVDERQAVPLGEPRELGERRLLR